MSSSGANCLNDPFGGSGGLFWCPESVWPAVAAVEPKANKQEVEEAKKRSLWAYNTYLAVTDNANLCKNMQPPVLEMQEHANTCNSPNVRRAVPQCTKHQKQPKNA